LNEYAMPTVYLSIA